MLWHKVPSWTEIPFRFHNWIGWIALCLAFCKIHFNSNLDFYGVILSVLLSEVYYPCRYRFFSIFYSIVLSIRDNLSIHQVEDKMDAMDTYTQLVKENIEYKVQKIDMGCNYELLNELVEIIADMVSVPRKTVQIANTDYPYELVKRKFLKLNDSRYVLASMTKTTSYIMNIKTYLLTALYNVPNTINSYYSAEVNHNLYER